VPGWEELQGTGTGAEEEGAAGGGHRGGRGKLCGKGGGGGKGKGGSKGKSKGKGKEAAGSEDDEGAGRAALELEGLKAADLFQTEGLLKHCQRPVDSGACVFPMSDGTCTHVAGARVRVQVVFFSRVLGSVVR
jgi:hypothetical protein